MGMRGAPALRNAVRALLGEPGEAERDGVIERLQRRYRSGDVRIEYGHGLAFRSVTVRSHFCGALSGSSCRQMTGRRVRVPSVRGVLVIICRGGKIPQGGNIRRPRTGHDRWRPAGSPDACWLHRQPDRGPGRPGSACSAGKRSRVQRLQHAGLRGHLGIQVAASALPLRSCVAPVAVTFAGGGLLEAYEPEFEV